MEKICDIAEAIMNITDNDVDEMQEVIDGQRRYNNPLMLDDFEKPIEPFVAADEMPECVAFKDYYASSAKTGGNDL